MNGRDVATPVTEVPLPSVHDPPSIAKGCDVVPGIKGCIFTSAGTTRGYRELSEF